MIDSLDREARKLGVTRQSIIKVWLAERLENSTLTCRPRAHTAEFYESRCTSDPAASAWVMATNGRKVASNKVETDQIFMVPPL